MASGNSLRDTALSVVKFIERNWLLNTALTNRSRDNLPNPIQGDDNSQGNNNQQGAGGYVPSNMPAIGDLFDLFNFQNQQ